MQPLISVPSDPTAIAEILATLIRSDRRSGAAEPISPKVRYGRDPKGIDFWASPRELNAAGKGDCAQLVRAAAQYVEPAEGVYIHVARTAAGFHTWISVRKVTVQGFAPHTEETVIDPSVDRGMPRPQGGFYAGGAFVQLWPNGKSAVKEGSIAEEHPQAPADYLRAAMRQATDVPPKKRKEFVFGHLKEWIIKANSDKERRDIAALLAVLSDNTKEVEAIKRKLAARDGSSTSASLIDAAKAVQEELTAHGVPLPMIFVMGNGASPPPPPVPPAPVDTSQDISDEEMQELLASMVPGCPGSCDVS